jgi:transcriptional regulator with XRE-family HTH domain
VKAPSERGVIGAWAYQARRELDLSVEQVADALAARGHSVSPATLRGIESGSKKPGARLLRVLGEALDSAPPGQAPTADEPSLAAAIVMLTQELAAMREERRALAERVGDLEATVARLVVPVLDVEGSGGPTGPAAPPVTTA